MNPSRISELHRLRNIANKLRAFFTRAVVWTSWSNPLRDSRGNLTPVQMPMPLKLFAVFIMLVTSPEVLAQEQNFMAQVSPKLQVFLNSHPSENEVFINSVREAFENRSVQLYYYYNKSPKIERASHHYTQTPGEVILRIQENQEPLDEFICILHEALSSKNESKAKEIMDQIRKGTISKHESALSFVKLGFKSSLATRDLITGMEFSETEKKNSYYYSRVKLCPDNFDDFLKYRPVVKRNPIKEYEKSYDELRKAQTTK